MKSVRILAVVPARLDSQRFPRKVLHSFYGLPMLEHVRRRALMCPSLDRVVVATCDAEVRDVMQGFGGEVVMTANTHRNGTDRAAEAMRAFDCTHVIILQGDEPLIVPDEIEMVCRQIVENPAVAVWNALTPIVKAEDLENPAIVKAAVSAVGLIRYMTRKNPGKENLEKESLILRKVQGVIAFRREILDWFVSAAPTPIEVSESIEQMRVIESAIEIRSVLFSQALPSVNLPSEVSEVEGSLQNNKLQSQLLDQVLKLSSQAEQRGAIRA